MAASELCRFNRRCTSFEVRDRETLELLLASLVSSSLVGVLAVDVGTFFFTDRDWNRTISPLALYTIQLLTRLIEPLELEMFESKLVLLPPLRNAVNFN